jgi:hypothetical protein
MPENVVLCSNIWVQDAMLHASTVTPSNSTPFPTTTRPVQLHSALWFNCAAAVQIRVRMFSALLHVRPGPSSTSNFVICGNAKQRAGEKGLIILGCLQSWGHLLLDCMPACLACHTNPACFSFPYQGILSTTTSVLLKMTLTVTLTVTLGAGHAGHQSAVGVPSVNTYAC